MLDKQGRTIVSVETFPDYPFKEGQHIYFYYKDKNKVLISTEEYSEEMLIGKVLIDKKGRFSVPMHIIKAFGTLNVIIGKKEESYYLLFFPMEKD